MSGVAGILGGTPVNTGSTTQHRVALFTSGAECAAMMEGVQTVSFTRTMFEFL